MPRPLSAHPFPTPAVLALCFVVVAAVGGLSCSTAAVPPAIAPPASAPVATAPTTTRPTATRTVVEIRLGSEIGMRTEVVRVGPDGRGITETPAGVLGQEVVVGHDHYVRLTHADLVLGVDRWIHTDLSVPAQRRYHEQNPVGVLDMGDELGRLVVGDHFGDTPVLSVRHPRPGETVVDLGDDRTITIRTAPAPDVRAIAPPPSAEVVDLVDLPDLVARSGTDAAG